jgi:hypothetical protein
LHHEDGTESYEGFEPIQTHVFYPAAERAAKSGLRASIWEFVKFVAKMDWFAVQRRFGKKRRLVYPNLKGL